MIDGDKGEPVGRPGSRTRGGSGSTAIALGIDLVLATSALIVAFGPAALDISSSSEALYSLRIAVTLAILAVELSPFYFSALANRVAYPSGTRARRLIERVRPRSFTDGLLATQIAVILIAIAALVQLRDW